VKIEQGFPMYPGTSLDYAVNWKKTGLPPGRYEAFIRLDYGSTYGEEKLAEKNLSFFVGEDGNVDSDPAF
jgi:hypothetical protein